MTGFNCFSPATLNNIQAISWLLHFIGCGNWNTQRKSPPCGPNCRPLLYKVVSGTLQYW